MTLPAGCDGNRLRRSTLPNWGRLPAAARGRVGYLAGVDIAAAVDAALDGMTALFGTSTPPVAADPEHRLAAE